MNLTFAILNNSVNFNGNYLSPEKDKMGKHIIHPNALHCINSEHNCARLTMHIKLKEFHKILIKKIIRAPYLGGD